MKTEYREVLTNHEKAIVDLITRVRHFIDQQGVKEKPAYAIRLVLEELLTNILKYAYPDGRRGEIEVALSVERDFVIIDVKDGGIPFDPRSYPAPDLDAPLEMRQPGGLGLHLLRSMAESLDYERAAGLNATRVKVKL